MLSPRKDQEHPCSQHLIDRFEPPCEYTRSILSPLQKRPVPKPQNTCKIEPKRGNTGIDIGRV
jgi:hypothetical protein